MWRFNFKKEKPQTSILIFLNAIWLVLGLGYVAWLINNVSAFVFYDEYDVFDSIKVMCHSYEKTENYAQLFLIC